MPDPRPPSILRRLAAFGPLSLYQRLRDLLLRPVRHDLGDVRREMDQFRRELEVLNAQAEAARHELDALRAAVVAGEQRTLDSARREVEAAVSPVRVRQQLLQGLLVSALDAAPSPPTGEALPLVSIVMATRNRAGCLGNAIDSVLAQSYPQWELLVVDDGSEDATAELLERYTDPRIRAQAIAHCGPSAARNHALRMARGELVAYLDSDNTWFPGFLAGAVAAFVADAGLELGYGALASEAHVPGEVLLFGSEFDRAQLEAANYIDLNTVVHRRACFERFGGFDESLQRAVDWDLLLRYTAQHPARLLPVLAARYRVRDQQRITDTVPIGPSWLAIRRRVDPVPVPPRPPRALYVIWHYPQLSETYVEGEIRCLLRFGADIAVWREVAPVSPYEPPVPVLEGDIAEHVRRFRPDVIHVHWLAYALERGAELEALGVPVTVRMHGFDVSAGEFRRLVDSGWLHRVYAFPMQLALLPGPHARVCATPSVFDTSYFQPTMDKDPRLVVRAGACLPSKDIGLFFELAKRLPSHRFVFAGVTCNKWEHYPAQLRELAARLESPAELRFDLPREQAAELISRAGIYLHTINPPHVQHGAPIGMPISIAEAMATGAWTLVRDLPELAAYVGDAGATYRDLDEAAALIAASAGWSAEEWRRRRVRASDRAFLYHADELMLRPLFEDWCELAARADARAGADLASAGPA